MVFFKIVLTVETANTLTQGEHSRYKSIALTLLSTRPEFLSVSDLYGPQDFTEMSLEKAEKVQFMRLHKTKTRNV